MTTADGRFVNRRQTSVSVVITTVGHKALSRAVSSALMQTHAPVEVIVVDDRPCPDEPPLQLSMTDSRVRFIRTRSKGANFARNRGIESSRGEIIALLDDDDYWFPHKLENQIPLLCGSLEPNATLVTCQAYLESARAVHPLRPYSHGTLADYLFCRHFPHLRFNAFTQTSSFLFLRELALQHPFREDLPSHQDWDWLLALEASSVTFLTVPEALYIYSAPSPGGITYSSGLANQQAWALQSIPRGSYALFGYFVTIAVPRALRSGDLRATRHALWCATRYGRFHGWTALMGLGYSGLSISVVLQSAYRRQARSTQPGSRFASGPSSLPTNAL